MIEEQIKVTENSRLEISEEIDELGMDSRQAWEGLMKEFENERKRLVLGINNQADARKLATYVMAEMGKDGDELLRRVGRLITTYAEPLAGSAKRRMEHIDASFEFQKGAQKKVFDAVGKVGARLGAWLAGQSTRALADAVLSMNRAAKLTKFKPWGAMKLASKFKTIGKIVALLGPVLDTVSVAIDIWTEHQLKKKGAELTESVDGFFREIRNELTLDHLRAECCPGLEEAQKVLDGLAGEQGDYRAVRDKLGEAERVLGQFNV